MDSEKKVLEPTKFALIKVSNKQKTGQTNIEKKIVELDLNDENTK